MSEAVEDNIIEFPRIHNIGTDDEFIAYYKDETYKIFHRVNGPAIEFKNGTKKWIFNGKYHREGGPAIETLDKSREWYLHGKRHRLDGPAIMSNGHEYYYLEGISFNAAKYWKTVANIRLDSFS